MTAESAAKSLTSKSPDQASGHSNTAPADWTLNEGLLLGDKRRQKRYATSEIVDVCLLDMNNVRLTGTLRDISKSGMRVELNMSVQVGDRLEVLLRNKAIIFAEVRYCRNSGAFYQVGASIDDVYYPRGPQSSPGSKTTRSGSPSDSQKRSQANRTSGRGFGLVMSSRHPVKAKSVGAHLNRNDIDNLLALTLSDTKTALLERHLASCDQCLDLMLLALEGRAASPSKGPNGAPE